MVDQTTPGGALAAQVIEALPPDIRALITKPGKTSERIKSAIRWASRPDPGVVRRHQRRNAAVQSFDDIQNARLRDMDAVARQIAKTFRRRAALTGAATGLPGGLWAVVAAGADVQLTAIYAVRMVADIAQAYGYNTSLLEEQADLADVLAVAAGVDSLRGVGTWLTRQELTHLIPELLPRLLTRLSVRITEEQAGKWAGRVIPGLGAVIGGAIDYTFLRVAGNRAIEHYHNRFMSQHGGDGQPLPAPAATAALPPPGAATPDGEVALATTAAPVASEGTEPGAASEAPTVSPAVAAPVSQSIAGNPAAAPDVVLQRSGTFAALLEVLIPGAGAFYTGRTGIAALWFLVSLAAVYIAGLQLSGPLATLGQGEIPSSLPGWVPYALGAAALWLVLRVLLAVRYARTYAALHANQPPESHLAAQLATFAFLALLITVGACGALGYLVYTAIASVVH